MIESTQSLPKGILSNMFIYSPTVKLVGSTTVDLQQIRDFLGFDWQTDAPGDAELLTETAGRLCYDSYAKPRPGGNSAYLDHIKEAAHGSVLEHTTYNFLISGVSRSLTHELVRHRVGTAYSQLSQRYVDESYCSFVVPPEIIPYPDLVEVFKKACTDAQTDYIFLTSRLTAILESQGHTLPRTELRKRARQSARSVLPNATETRLLFSCNARTLRHIIEMRCSIHAEIEIRRLFNVVYDLIKLVSPKIFDDYKTSDLPDGTRVIDTEHRKI